MYKLAITSRIFNQPHYFFFNSTYYQFLSHDFFIELVLPRINNDYQDIVERNDALLICGGDDIHPYYLKEEAHSTIQIENEMIETMDFALLQQFYHANKPIIGICRGIQVINTFFKGTLYQDIPTLYPTNINHRDNHHVSIQSQTFLSRYFASTLIVNSFHHQAIKDVAPLFHINAISDDGLIEGIENKNVIAVQWHPERMNSYHQNQFILMLKEFISLHDP